MKLQGRVKRESTSPERLLVKQQGATAGATRGNNEPSPPTHRQREGTTHRAGQSTLHD